MNHTTKTFKHCFLRLNKHLLPSTTSSTTLIKHSISTNSILITTLTFSPFIISSLHTNQITNSIPKPLHLPLPMSISTSSSEMEEVAAQVLVLCGKSNEEDGIAESMINKSNVLKLPDLSPIHVCTLREIEKETTFRGIGIEEDAFQVKRYMGLLKTEAFGRFLLYSPRLSSTQEVISHNFSELPLGAACVADTQFKGKGRTNNVWESPKGCLMFSFTLQMENGRILPFLQYVISLAMVEAVKAVCQQNGIQNLDVKIKWPNDLYLDGRKVGGILCTSTYRSKRFNVSAGIGLNVGNEKPSISLNSVVQRLHSPDQQLQREDIMATFFNEFEKFYSIFRSQGFQPFEELYCKTWLHSDQRVIVQDGETESIVTIQGITSEGYLLAIGDDGERCQLHPDGNSYVTHCLSYANSFDFFRGLVRRKLT
ncbi:hypothetical protein Leryth_009215 [Lithospermum erythrorhizon]|nr:hypothetical protein Leryth_009215 [Lithospermum erythrorhizon]